MPDGSAANAVDNGSYHQLAFLPGRPGGWASIRFQGIDDDTGIWYDPETKSIRLRFAGSDIYTFDDTGGINVAAPSGPIKMPDGTEAAPSYAFATTPGNGLFQRNASRWGVTVNGTEILEFATGGLLLPSTSSIFWLSGTSSGGSIDLSITRDAAGTFAQRNSTNAQTFRLYNTFTDASNYERLGISWAANLLTIATEGAGTGSSRDMVISAGFGGAGTLTMKTGGTSYLVISGGNITGGSDNGSSLGTSGVFFNTLYVRRRINRISAITYSASMTPDMSQGELLEITATNGTAFTINAPTSPTTGQCFNLKISNTSGGALGVITWNAVFKMAAWASPATGFNRSIEFYYNGTNWIEFGRTTADVPN